MREPGDESEREGTERFPIIRLGDLADRHPALRPAIVDGLLREGETAGIHAKSKVGKSWLAYSLGLSVAGGFTWLDRFDCQPRRVLLLDYELHPENLANRIPAVASALRISPRVWRDSFDVVSLRGKGGDVIELGALFDSLGRHSYGLVIVDPLYRCIPAKVSENDNAEMAAVFNHLDGYAGQVGAAIVFIHHQSKGEQSGKDVVDVGAGAGSISRAVDAHIVLRAHEDPSCVVMDAALRSFAPIQPAVLRWEFPLWRIDAAADAGLLKGLKTPRQHQQASADLQSEQVIIEAIESGKDTTKQIRLETGISKSRTERLLERMESSGLISSVETRLRGQRTRRFSLGHSVRSLGT